MSDSLDDIIEEAKSVLDVQWVGSGTYDTKAYGNWLEHKVFYTPDDLWRHVVLSDEIKNFKVVNGNRVIFLNKVHSSLFTLTVASGASLGIYDRTFDYKTEYSASKALGRWNDLKDEPTGWFRDHGTGRRREYFPDGNYREWIQW